MFQVLAVLASGLAVVSAYHAPTTQLQNTNAITYPNTASTPVVGTPYEVKYDGAGLGDKISLVLWRGPGENLVLLKAIADSVPNTGVFVWTPDSSLEDDVTHYGLQLISEVDGRFQWSTQFGVSNKGGVKPSSSAPPAQSSAPPKPSSAPPTKPSSSAPAPPKHSESSPAGGWTPPKQSDAPSGGWTPPSGGYTPPKNGTGGYSPPPAVSTSYTVAPPKATGYTGPLSNNAGRFTVSAVSAVFALGAAVLLL